MSNLCPLVSVCTCTEASTSPSWRISDVQDLLNMAHENGISVYATYTDTTYLDALQNQCHNITNFDGIALDYESFDYQTSYISLLNQVQDVKIVADVCGIYSHISISYIWTNIVTYNNLTQPLSDHVMDLLSPGDSLDIQVDNRDPCEAERRASSIILSAIARGLKVWIVLETKGDPSFDEYSWSWLGERRMWGYVRRSFLGNVVPSGYFLHHYKDGINKGGVDWLSVGQPYCPEYYDICGVCGSNGSSCDWTALGVVNILSNDLLR